MRTFPFCWLPSARVLRLTELSENEEQGKCRGSPGSRLQSQQQLAGIMCVWEGLKTSISQSIKLLEINTFLPPHIFPGCTLPSSTICLSSTVVQHVGSGARQLRLDAWPCCPYYMLCLQIPHLHDGDHRSTTHTATTEMEQAI